MQISQVMMQKLNQILIKYYEKMSQLIWITSPHLSSSHSVAHKATLLFLHLSVSLAMALASSQDFQPAIVLSFSTVRRQVVLARPTFLLPIGVCYLRWFPYRIHGPYIPVTYVYQVFGP